MASIDIATTGIFSTTAKHSSGSLGRRTAPLDCLRDTSGQESLQYYSKNARAILTW